MPLTFAALAIFFSLYLSSFVSVPPSFYHTHSFTFEELASSLRVSHYDTLYSCDTLQSLYDTHTYVSQFYRAYDILFFVPDGRFFYYRSRYNLHLIIYHLYILAVLHGYIAHIITLLMAVEIEINSTADRFIFLTLALWKKPFLINFRVLKIQIRDIDAY